MAQPPNGGIDDPSDLLEEREPPSVRAVRHESDFFTRLDPQDRPAARAAIESARRDLAARSGIGHDQIGVETIEKRDWPDAALGVRQKGGMYAQMIVPGFFIRLRTGDRSYEYHSDMNGRVVAAK